VAPSEEASRYKLDWDNLEKYGIDSAVQYSTNLVLFKCYLLPTLLCVEWF